MNRNQTFNKISEDLASMAGILLKQIQIVKEQLEQHGVDYKDEEINQNELVLDSFEVKLRKNITNAMVLHTPRATDLRKLMSCYDICLNIERMGDLTRNVHKHLRRVDFSNDVFSELKETILSAYSTMETMVKNAIQIYTYKDPELSRLTIELDDIVDNLYTIIRGKLIAYAKEKSMNETEIDEILSISDLSYNIERIADYATNIIESSIYLIEGKNIQHNKINY